jgi:hypothetical protein
MESELFSREAEAEKKHAIISQPVKKLFAAI